MSFVLLTKTNINPYPLDFKLEDHEPDPYVRSVLYHISSKKNKPIRDVYWDWILFAEERAINRKRDSLNKRLAEGNL